MDSYIYNILTNNGFSHLAAINIVAQARHETGNYTSELFKKYNNLFGYGFSGSKWQASKSKPVNKAGEPVNWAIYKTPKDSVMEIVDYWNRRKKEGTIKSLSQLENTANFATYLKNKGYYSASYTSYLNALKNNLPKVDISKPPLDTPIIIGMFFFA